MKTKIVAITFLWGAIIFSTFFVVDEILIAQVALVANSVGCKHTSHKVTNLQKVTISIRNLV